MRFLAAFLSLVVFSASSRAYPDTEIWLISGSDCNICSIYEKAKEIRGYHGFIEKNDERYRIKNIDKQEIPESVKSYFEPSMSDNRHWNLQLTVAVVQSGAVRYSGNIAESVDWSQAGIDKKYMQPPATETLEALHSYGFDYGRYLEENLNLEYFIDKASKPESSQPSELKIDVSPLNEGKNDVKASIWGTALQPAANGLFISTRIKQLQSLFGEGQVFTAYANGMDHSSRDALIKEGDSYKFIRSNVNAQFSANLSGLEAWFSHIANSNHKRHLLVQVGHSGPAGTPVWGNPLTIGPETLERAIGDTGKDVAVVSGACHSGLFANVGECGFYAAHPDAIATGCQTSLEAIEASDDYLNYFYLDIDEKADANDDNVLSFSEAHWYASSQLELHNLVYSDTDVAVDAFFREHPESLPKALKIGEVANLVKLLTPEEQLAFDAMARGLDDSLELNLLNHVELHINAIDRLDGHTEKSSQQRNELSGVGYPLNLVLLARRGVYVQSNQKFDDATVACGEQPITDYVDLKWKLPSK